MMGSKRSLPGRLLDAVRGKDKSKVQAFYRQPFSAFTPPYETPSPYADPRNSRNLNLYDRLSGGGTVWSHHYGLRNAREIELLFDSEPLAKMVIMKIRNEMFRRGFEWKEKYAGKCSECDKEYPVMPKQSEQIDEIKEDKPTYVCDDCGGALVEPEPSEYQECHDVLEHPIKNNPFISFENLNSMIWRDVLQLGNGYLIADIQYPLANKTTGPVVKGEIVEIPDSKDMKRKITGFYYVTEKFVKKVMDQYGNLGGKYFVCLKCRNLPEYRPEDVYQDCSMRGCGCKTYPVHLIISTEQEDTAFGNQYYIEGEYHWTPFDPDSLMYSMAPGQTLGTTLETMIYQSWSFMDLYSNNQEPPYLGWVRTDDTDGFLEWTQGLKDHKVQGTKPWLAVQTEQTGPPVGVEKLAMTPKEMDAMEYREVLENIVATFYGITPSERGSPTAGSGLGNQSKDITISTRNLMGWQDRNNEGLLQWIAQLFEIKSWDLIHVIPETEDSQRQAERDIKVIEAAKAAQEAGLTPHRREGTEELENDYDGDYYTPDEFQANNSFSMNPFGDEGGDDMGGQGDDVGGPDTEGAPGGNYLDNYKEWISIPKGQAPPKGARTKRGPKGGTYYESGGGGAGSEDTQSKPNSNDTETSEGGTPKDAMVSRGVSEEDAEYFMAMVEELEDVGGVVNEDGTMTLYHRTNKASKNIIQKSGRMMGKEDGLFFSTKKDSSQAEGFGDETIVLNVPIETLQLDDIFDDEAHLRIPLDRAGGSINVKDWIIDDKDEADT